MRQKSLKKIKSLYKLESPLKQKNLCYSVLDRASKKYSKKMP